MYGVNHALAFDGNSKENSFDYLTIIDENLKMEEEVGDSYSFHHGCSRRIHDNFGAKRLVEDLEFVQRLEGNVYLKSNDGIFIKSVISILDIFNLKNKSFFYDYYL